MPTSSTSAPIARAPHSDTTRVQLSQAALPTRTGESISVEGTPVPYRLRSDDLVTTTLILSSFATVWAVIRLWGFLSRSLRNFFYDIRQRGNPAAATPAEGSTGNWLPILHCCFLFSLLFICFVQHEQPALFGGSLPYARLLLAFLATAGFYLLREGAYAFVGAVFFERWQNDFWRKMRVLTTFVCSLFFLLLDLLVIYFDLSFPIAFWCFVLLIGVSRLLLLYRCYSVFFTYTGGAFHLILYFCTLEIAPIMLLMRTLRAII